jgi:hypothetical protein
MQTKVNILKKGQRFVIVPEPVKETDLTQKGERVKPDLRRGIKVPVDHKYWQMDFDLDTRAWRIYLTDTEPDATLTSDDGETDIDVCFGEDNLPVVVGVTIRNPNKFSIIQDWVEDGIDACLPKLNQFRTDHFEDNHWKGYMVREQE